jgi:hypothetical protein
MQITKTILTLLSLSVLCHAQREDLRSELTTGLSCLSYQWDDTKRVHILPTIGYTFYFYGGGVSLSAVTATDFANFSLKMHDYTSEHYMSSTQTTYQVEGSIRYRTLTQEFYLVPRIFIRKFFVTYNPGIAFLFQFVHVNETWISNSDTTYHKYPSVMSVFSPIHETHFGYQYKRFTVDARISTRHACNSWYKGFGIDFQYAVVQRKRGEFGKRALIRGKCGDSPK